MDLRLLRLSGHQMAHPLVVAVAVAAERQMKREHLSRWTDRIPIADTIVRDLAYLVRHEEHTCGFHVTPVVCHCLTYFCSPSSKAIKDRAQATCLISLERYDSRKLECLSLYSVPPASCSRIFEFLQHSVSVELSRVFHFPDEWSGGGFLYIGQRQEKRIFADEATLTTATQPQAPTPSPTAMRWFPTARPSFDFDFSSLKATTA
jgi:hypothetical protein